MFVKKSTNWPEISKLASQLTAYGSFSVDSVDNHSLTNFKALTTAGPRPDRKVFQCMDHQTVSRNYGKTKKQTQCFTSKQ